jgi:hypothetical protein
MKTNQIFQYNGSPITFYKDDNVILAQEGLEIEL